ncbi:breast cancer anti-estrogen resistance protein 3 homolog isoform X2 [Saccostrea echinata]|uniref:breast cancer anti-estrogen resistance protein 3 homolog isoform X2 n=1 Tax=Saccostrea echinata TaxID=191078 RepID=UPI002A8013AB|nr:breast cancer anti-estrogen resistance protein 3 homolog isoform X2 [Saccostrea echinata]
MPVGSSNSQYVEQAIDRLEKRIVLERQQVMAHKHIPIETWLEALGLREYEEIFTGFSGVEDLLNLTEADVRDLGLKNSAHRAKIVSSLRILKEKYERGYRKPRVIQRSHSASAQLSCSPNNNFPDYQVVNISPERLEHDLIGELQADPSELRHWPWYHGSISRQHAEKTLSHNGDFLVRDCISQPGDFVLSCCWRGVRLHFIINSQITERDSHIPEITYSLEEDKFCSVQDLVQFYMSHRKCVTKTSGAFLLNPIGRTMPLSYYDNKYGYSGGSPVGALLTPGHGANERGSPYSSPHTSPKGSPRLQRRPFRTGSQPILKMDSAQNPAGGTIDRSESTPSIKQLSPSPGGTMSPALQIQHQRSGSEPMMNPDGSVSQNTPKSHYLSVQPRMAPSTSDSHLNKPPPPKPSRIPSVKYIGKDRPKITIRNKELYEDDDRDYSDYYQVRESPSWLKKCQPPTYSGNLNNNYQPSNNEGDYDNNFNSVHFENKYAKDNPETLTIELPEKIKKKSDTQFPVLGGRDYAEIPSPLTPKGNQIQVIGEEEVQMRKKTIKVPEINSHTSLKPNEFKSSLIHSDNKPLEPSVLLKVKEILLDNNSHRLAEHMTKVDLDYLKVVNDLDLGLGVVSGLELITLPQGKQLRQNVIERCYCMKVFVMVKTLTCGTVTERAKILSQWIQIAVDLRATFGNLFGFASVMEGLTSEHISRLRDTWLILRRNHTNSAFQFDTKLKSAYKSLMDGSGLLPLQNVSIPDIAPLVFLLERDEMSLSNYLPWELSDQNSGLDILLTHLDTARLITAQCGLYKVTAQNMMKTVKSEDVITDAFQTEFHLRMLWGAKGASVDRNERQNKYEQLLAVLSNRAEPPGDDGTAV